MHISANSIDDLLGGVYRLLTSKEEVVTASRGDFREESGVLLELTNPRARLSRSANRGRPFSALGELLWYLSGSNKVDHMVYYTGRKYSEENSDDGITVHGAYGPRLINYHPRIFNYFGINQIRNIEKILKESPSTRRAVIQLYSAKDIDGNKRRKEIPCTCTLQFLIRDGRLNLFANLRSSDAYLGLPHDVFSFTMLQEIIARSLGVEIGVYKHFAGSLHLYEEHFVAAKNFIDEGWQTTLLDMPPMPLGSPWPSVNSLVRAEYHIRTQKSSEYDVSDLDPYWADLVSMLKVLRAHKDGSIEEIKKICDGMVSQVYAAYIKQKYLSA